MGVKIERDGLGFRVYVEEIGQSLSFRVDQQELCDLILEMASLLADPEDNQLPLDKRPALFSMVSPAFSLMVDEDGRIGFVMAVPNFPAIRFFMEDMQSRDMANAITETLLSPQNARFQERKH